MSNEIKALKIWLPICKHLRANAGILEELGIKTINISEHGSRSTRDPMDILIDLNDLISTLMRESPTSDLKLKSLSSWKGVKEGDFLYYYDKWDSLIKCKVMYSFPKEIEIEIISKGLSGCKCYVDPKKDNPNEWLTKQ